LHAAHAAKGRRPVPTPFPQISFRGVPATTTNGNDACRGATSSHDGGGDDANPSLYVPRREWWSRTRRAEAPDRRRRKSETAA